MTSFYVAAPLPLRGEAIEVARSLRARGHVVRSTWHDRADSTVDAEAALPVGQAAELADTCLREIREAQELVLLIAGETNRHGNILEAGYALGLGRSVRVVPVADGAVLPTILLHACDQYETREDFELAAGVAW